jgi:hypothetical protein
MVVFISLAACFEETSAKNKSPFYRKLLFQVNFLSQRNKLFELGHVSIEVVLIEIFVVLKLVLKMFKFLHKVITLLFKRNNFRLSRLREHFRIIHRVVLKKWFTDIRNRLHHLQLKVVNACVEQLSHDADDYRCDIIIVKSHRLEHIRFAILLQRTAKVNVQKVANREFHLLLLVPLLVFFLVLHDAGVDAFNVRQVRVIQVFVEMFGFLDHEHSGAHEVLVVTEGVAYVADQLEEEGCQLAADCLVPDVQVHRKLYHFAEYCATREADLSRRIGLDLAFSR